MEPPAVEVGMIECLFTTTKRGGPDRPDYRFFIHGEPEKWRRHPIFL